MMEINDPTIFSTLETENQVEIIENLFEEIDGTAIRLFCYTQNKHKTTKNFKNDTDDPIYFLILKTENKDGIMKSYLRK